jgi:TatA/E family protein of Tat protein translocase
VGSNPTIPSFTTKENHRKESVMDLFAPTHLLLILLIVLLLFGPQKLPQIGRSLGEGIREFKKAMKDATKQ